VLGKRVFNVAPRARVILDVPRVFLLEPDALTVEPFFTPRGKVNRFNGEEDANKNNHAKHTKRVRTRNTRVTIHQRNHVIYQLSL
jgi:hypothetical protein